jgi:3-hydroxypropanoate dehydrogenase
VTGAIQPSAMNQLFDEARTYNEWSDKPVDEASIRALYEHHFLRPGMAEVTAMRNGTLQGAYLIIAARALGLDCGPMSGFDNAAVDAAFFAGTTVKSNFICSIGSGKPGTPFPRNPRLTFEEACRFA